MCPKLNITSLWIVLLDVAEIIDIEAEVCELSTNIEVLLKPPSTSERTWWNPQLKQHLWTTSLFGCSWWCTRFNRVQCSTEFHSTLNKMDVTLPGVTLVVKAPNQKIEDQVIECGLEWTIRKLKEHLSMVYPNQPVSVSCYIHFIYSFFVNIRKAA